MVVVMIMVMVRCPYCYRCCYHFIFYHKNFSRVKERSRCFSPAPSLIWYLLPSCAWCETLRVYQWETWWETWW